MTMQSGESSHPLLSCTDGIAASTTDLLLLVGRVFLGWLFLASAWPKLLNIAGFEGYLTALKVPAPTIMAWIGALVEFLIGFTLILGIATRYAALVCALFLIVATALAHRYWEYPPATDAGSVHQLPQEPCDPGRCPAPIPDRAGPLQHRSGSVEAALTVAPIVNSTVPCWQGARLAPAPRALPT